MMKKYLVNLPEGNALSGIILISCTTISLLLANNLPVIILA